MASIIRGLNYLFSNRAQFCDSFVRNFLKFLPDKLYITLRYRFKMGRWINWKNPRTFSEKLQWLKVYNRQSEYTMMVDKFAVKGYVSNIIGSEYVIPTLGVWDSPELIDWDSLPDQFVLKTTHAGGGGGVIICKDKTQFNRQSAIDKLKHSLKCDIYSEMREWPYKNVIRRVIAEQYICPSAESTIQELRDYKFFCFNGKVRFLKVDFGRFVEHHANYYSPDKILLEFGEAEVPPVYDYKVDFPANFPQMLVIAEKLSFGCPFVRVDLYSLNNEIYFGELTFYPASGLGKFTPETQDYKLGDLLDLPKI